MKVKDKILEQSIKRLNISDNTIKILERNKIMILEDLCKKTKTDLKEIELSQKEIDMVQIQLQLEGLNLRGGL
ncbi:MAG: hypothetical protein IJE59_02990 [Clostridia bacterium]|nr:hypothetical protein [Clostridia bacterium]